MTGQSSSCNLQLNYVVAFFKLTFIESGTSVFLERANQDPCSRSHILITISSLYFLVHKGRVVRRPIPSNGSIQADDDDDIFVKL